MRRSMRTMMLAAVLGIILITGHTQAQTADQLLGVWLTPNGQSKVELQKCGDLYCGSIVWMQNPGNDERNQDKAKRNRPLVGTRIATDFKYDGGTSWIDGSLYAPESGRTVPAKLVLVNDDTLEVRVSFRGMNRAVTWTRVK